MSSDIALQVEGLSLARGDRDVLCDIDLSVASGEVVALIGPSGAGKTSLLKCVNLLMRPDAGRLRLDDKLYFCRSREGECYVPVDPAEIRRQIGMVFQEWNLWPNRTMWENVAEGPRIVLRKTKEESREIARSCCRRVGLEDKLNRYPNALSGGEKQRAAIARALAMTPNVLMLDEVTSALDPLLVAEVLDVIADIATEGRTILLVTHHIGFAGATADRVGFLQSGRLVEYGAASRLLSEPQTEALRGFLSKLERVR